MGIVGGVGIHGTAAEYSIGTARVARLHPHARGGRHRPLSPRAGRHGRADPLTCEPSRAVLVTGCSSGIGAATAAHLAAGGWTVYATARRPETLAELEAKGCRTLALDVTDEASRKAAVDAVVEAEGAVGVLVNNAGYSQSGRGRVGRRRARTRPVRDQRVRPAGHVPAGAAGHARAGLGEDRERLLDGRALHVPGRRHLPRDQARGRGAVRRAAVRGQGLRRRRDPRSSRASSVPASATPRCARSTRLRRTPVRTRTSTRRSREATAGVYEKRPARPPRRAARGGRPQDRARARRAAGRGPAIRSQRRPRALLAIHAVLPDAGWDAMLRGQFPQPRQALTTCPFDSRLHRAVGIGSARCRRVCDPPPRPTPRPCSQVIVARDVADLGVPDFTLEDLRADWATPGAGPRARRARGAGRGRRDPRLRDPARRRRGGDRPPRRRGRGHRHACCGAGPRRAPPSAARAVLRQFAAGVQRRAPADLLRAAGYAPAQHYFRLRADLDAVPAPRPR